MVVFNGETYCVMQLFVPDLSLHLFILTIQHIHTCLFTI